jgi:hypothetical protein
VSKVFILVGAIFSAYSAAAFAQSLGIVNRSEGSFIFLDLKSEQSFGYISRPGAGEILEIDIEDNYRIAR